MSETWLYQSNRRPDPFLSRLVPIAAQPCGEGEADAHSRVGLEDADGCRHAWGRPWFSDVAKIAVGARGVAARRLLG
jgi:hypothetical protein